MSWLDYIPVVSHAKAGIQYIGGDKDGATETMERFHTKTPIVSHTAAIILAACGRDKEARQCWEGGNETMDSTPLVGHVKGTFHYLFGDQKGGNQAMKAATDTSLAMIEPMPVLGHIKGVVHYAMNDKDAGNRAMLAATRTTTVIGAGAGGFLMAGPGVAVTLGIGAGAEWDLLTAIASGRKNVNGIVKIVENPTNVNAYIEGALSVIGDSLTGYSGGKIAERVVQASEIRTAEKLQRIRQEKGFSQRARISDAAKSREIFCEVKHTESGKTYTGVNETVRNAYEDPSIRPNEFLKKNNGIKNVLKRHPASCAENQALHKYVVDNPNSSTLNTRINTLEVRPNGEIYTVPPCDNCNAYKHVVGHTNTNVQVSLS